ncbi:autotransporter-associated beta strand repeat-containing protein [Luteolibacter yonseiensis]|uniref:Autotransporter-associated beta strand repeat-containing protein n=1 Tax=Luteolibacter yonseiensis TaxID=1144680 RepID=A0A934R466_9BACT|nr:autotransporter-associated beta strand repeat-containing protein [Luteolibacter yonseiensis]MBK1816806.1 autotransporter-associated beta strand repeat-containing protein [Luteolibacter yonseiensis]
MKPRNPRLLFSATVITAVFSIVTSNHASAASQTWDGETDANWATVTNWVSNTGAPGIIYTANSTNTTDVATFNSAINATTLAGSAGNPIITETNRMIGRILFDTAGVESHHIGAASGSPTLTFGNNLTILDVTASVIHGQTINAPVALHLPSSTNGGFTIQNNSTTSGATLTLAGGILNAPNSGRGTLATLRGSNTGENTVSGNIVLTQTAGITSTLTKADPGTWVFSGTNAFAPGGGVIVSDGVLAAAGNAALGTNATANAQAATINGGVLEIRNGVTIDNGVSLNLNGGAIRGAGTSATNGRIRVAATAAASVTLSTAASGDVFTIGNGDNELTGGAGDSVVHVAGPGTVVQAFASNYAGTWSVDSGTLQAGAPTSLGTLGSVNVAGGARLLASSQGLALTSLTGSGAVGHGGEGISTLTANISGSNTFAGQLQDGAAGALGLTKTGAGVLNLAGVSSYTDTTLVSSGTLNITGSLGNTPVGGSAGTTLSGNGSISGAVSVGNNMHLAPGDGGNAAIGTLTVGSLALESGSQLDIGITNTTTLDKVVVTGSGGLIISGGQVNINGGSGPFTTNGVYNLIGYSGTLNGLPGSLSVNGLNKSVTKTYTFGASGGFVTLTVANSGAVQTFWNTNADGNWSTNANWTPATAPNGTGAFVGFGGGGTEITADRTITVNGSFTAGTLAFNGVANGRSYILAGGSGANITLKNGSTGAFVTDTSGNHTINSPLTLTTDGSGFAATFAVINPGDTLTVGGAISGDGSPLLKEGPGTLVLNGVNTFTNGTVINGGTLQINSAESLGDIFGTTTIHTGTLRAAEDITSTALFNLTDSTSKVSVAAGKSFTISGQITDGESMGTLNKVDAGTLALTGANSYSGGTVVNGGIVQVSNANSLGSTTGPLVLNNAVVQATAGFNSSRGVTLGSVNSTFSVDPSVTYTLGGAITGSGTLNKSGSGTLSLGAINPNPNTYSGGTVISAGVLAVNRDSFLGPGTVTFQGGTLQNNYGNNFSYGFGNPISVPVGQVGTINMNNRMSLGSTAVVTGGGTLNVNLNTTVTRDDLNNSWVGFTGQVNFAGTGTARMLNNSGTFDTNSFANCSVDVGGSAFLQPVTNSGGNIYFFGALSGSSPTAGFAGATAGTGTLSVGALNGSSTFAGQINGNNALTKTGTGTLTLSGTNTYTGSTTVNGGSLELAATGHLRFVPGANGVSNKITGSGTVVLNGAFNIDLATANTTSGNSWLLVDVALLDETYGPTFSVDGFTRSGTTWTKVDGGKTWTFDQATGLLGLVSVGYSSWTGDPANGLSVGVNDGAGLDPDADGISNLLEYVLGGIPAGTGASDTSILPAQALDATDLTLTFRRSDLSESDVVLKVQWSADMVTWTDFITVGPVDALPAVDVSEDVPTAALDTVVVKIPRAGREAGGRLFGRIHAVK